MKRSKRGGKRSGEPAAGTAGPAQPGSGGSRPPGRKGGPEPGERFALSLLEYSFDLILLVGRDGSINYVSPSAERILGYPPSEVTGSTIFEFIHPDDLERARGFYYTHTDSKTFSRLITLRVRHRDGSWRELEAVGNNLLHDPGVRGIVISARDITERRLLEEDLRRSEEYFRYITENTHDIISVLDADGVLRYVSPSIKNITGYEAEEIIGQRAFDLIHPDDIANTMSIFTEGVRESAPAARAEYRWMHKDGTWHIHEAFGINALDNPSMHGVIVHARDITERKRWEGALRESEEKYRLIYDFTGEAIYTYDTDFVVIGVNKKACELIGYEEHEILGRNMLELNILHPDDYERTMRDIQRLYAGEVVRDELRFIRKDGSVAIGDVTGAPLYNHEGLIIAFTNVARDITENRNMELRLERFNQCLLELGPDPLENIRKIVLTGSEVLEGFGLIYARMDKGRLLVYSAETAGDFIVCEDPERYLCYGLINAGLESSLSVEQIAGTPYEGDPFATAGGFRSFLAYPTHLRGKIAGSLCLFSTEPGSFNRDDVNLMGMLSRALTIEEERLAHEESIRHFVDIASHELRTPLSIIKGYADAFQFGDLMELNDFQLEKIRIINSKADKMAKTINDLLDLSRIERGHFVAEKMLVEVEPLVRSAVRQMQEKGAPNVFEVEFSDGLGEWEMDPEQIVDALLILLDNAAHYSPPSSNIRIEAGPCEEGICLSVLDRGAGVPEKDRESIFERFYQLEDSRHHSATGMGLGLYIAWEIVRAHDGRIWYEPRDGGGSIFSIVIP
ncbi:MAG: PAS domain S-box protein [Actinomycetota bacterium]